MASFLLILFWSATLTQLFFWIFIFSRLAFHRQPPLEADSGENAETPVSVVICARNEAENLRKNLPFFLNQDYPVFEVIVVNDNSFDKTWDLLLDVSKKNPILRPINLNEVTLPGKKTALTEGILAARYDVVLLSDADCRPASRHWLRLMQSVLQDDKDIGLGFSPYRSEKGFLNIFIRFEAIYTAIQYLSFSLVKFPYMGVGRNLIYRKSLFFRAGGFRSHEEIASGDDDLFVNQAADARNTVICIHPNAFVYSQPESSWRGYYHQKSRHLTTGRRYRRRHQAALGALSASHFLHYAAALALVAGFGSVAAVVTGYLVRMCVVSCCYSRILKKFQDEKVLRWIPLLDALFTGYFLAFAPILLIGNSKQWK